ncbi:MAG: fructokinase [Solirubrobacteraceae bacterium]|nr:fructokinase [Solirubrobacteraceae bacterium]
MRTLCFGEALVDLICEHPAASLAEAGAFVAHPGGVSANVAVAAARAGADVALVGGAGDDAWGGWLRDRLGAEGVGVQSFELTAATATGLAFVTLDERGEPTYHVRGEALPAAGAAWAQRLLDAVEDADALCLHSNALVGKAAAALAMKARDRTLELERPVVFDANIRLARWDGNRGRAGAAAGACVPGAFLVKCNVLEARLMTGESHPEAAAASLLAAGAQHVVVTLGTRGAILRAKRLRRDVAAAPANVVSTVGAGDVFTGVVLAALAKTDFYGPAIAAALPDAVEQAARACERWGALE